MPGWDRTRYGECVGVHRAVVVANRDPLENGRLQVSFTSDGSVAWAARVLPVAAFLVSEVPIGAGVWVAFENDDPDRPVVLGLIDPPARRESLSRGLEAMGDAWDQGHAAGTTDSDGGSATLNPYR